MHASGIPWDDPSGDRLRQWLSLDRSQFYDESLTALVPMGFCYPGSGKSGDAPPRPECAPLWHERLRAELTQVKLTLLIGRFAQNYYLSNAGGQSVTSVVRNWRQTAPSVFPLPHPSPRNNRWLSSNPWFEADVLPELQQVVHQALQTRARRKVTRRDP